jgi:hypothetical protein
MLCLPGEELTETIHTSESDEVASVATMSDDSEDLSIGDECSSSVSTAETMSQNAELCAAGVPCYQNSFAMASPWLTMVQVVIVDRSKLAATPKSAQSSPKQTRSGKSGGFAEASKNCDDGTQTTVMLRNLPTELTRDMLMRLMDDQGFAGEYNFVYMPIDFVKQVGLGYAFVNLCRNDVAPRFWKCFDRFCSWPLSSSKVCRLGWSTPHQGLEKHVERYRNSPLMHKDVPDEIRPVLLQDGIRIDFPPPTKALKAPRLKASHRLSEFWKKPETA